MFRNILWGTLLLALSLDAAAVAWLGEINTRSDLLSVSRTTTQRPDFIYATKYTVPATTDESLLPPVFQNVHEYPLHVEFLAAEFPERFGGLTADEYTNLVLRRATRLYFAGGFFQAFPDGGGSVYGFSAYHDASAATQELTLEEVAHVWEELSGVFHVAPVHYIPITPREIETARGWQDAPFPIHFPGSGPAPDYQAYSRATNYGVMRVLEMDEFYALEREGGLSWQDILVLPEAPGDIDGIVAGVITGEPQSELSHTNVRSLRRGTPNAYLKNATEELHSSDGMLVRLTLGFDDYSVTPATLAEAEAWWNETRPRLSHLNEPDYDWSDILSLAELAAATDTSMHASRFGGKATGLGKLNAVLDASYQVQGFAIPVRYYREWMDGNLVPSELRQPPAFVSFSEYIAELIDSATFRTDPAWRKAKLEEFRKYARDYSIIDANLLTEIEAWIRMVYGSDARMVRFRSSSNIEDSVEFNGAGLYDSESVCLRDSLDGDETGPSHCDPTQPKERTMERALRRVWSSLWNFRAVEERDYYQVPHESSAIGIVVTPAFLDESANGVIFTGDPVNSSNNDYLVNVQWGDEEVVQPEPGVRAEKDALTLEDGEVVAIKRLAGSSLLPPGEWVLSASQLELLGEVVAAVDGVYPIDLQGYPREDVLLDLEFKFDATGELKIKQARPFLRVPAGLDAGPRIFIPAGTCSANGFKEFATLPYEYSHRARIEFVTGTHALPVDSPTAEANWIAALEWGRQGHFATPLGPGVITLNDQPQYLRYSYGQRFLADELVLDITLESLTFRKSGDGLESSLITFDETFLAYQLYMHATYDEGGPWPEYMQFGSCEYPLLQLWQLDFAWGEGSADLYLRWTPPAAGSGPARLVSATAELLGQMRQVDSFWDLVYSADHHNWNERFWVLFRQPIDDVHGLELRAGSFGSESTVGYLDASFKVVATATADRFVRTQIGELPETPTPTPTPTTSVTPTPTRTPGPGEIVFPAPEVVSASHTGEPDLVLDAFPRVYARGEGAPVVAWTARMLASGTEVEHFEVFGSYPGSETAFAFNSHRVGVRKDEDAGLATDGRGLWMCVWHSSDALLGSGFIGPGPLGVDFDILFATRRAPSPAWSGPRALAVYTATDTGADVNPRIETDGRGRWIAVWTTTEDFGLGIGADLDVFFSISDDEGTTWSQPRMMDPVGALDDFFDFAPHLVTDGHGTWLCAWSSGAQYPHLPPQGDMNVLLSRSSDNGETWSTPVFLNPEGGLDDGDDWRPQLATDTWGNWLIAWYTNNATLSGPNRDFDVVVRSSTDDGETWTPTLVVSGMGGGDQGDDAHPSPSTDRHGRWVLAWHSQNTPDGQKSDWDVHFATSEDIGLSWSPEVAVHPDAPSDSADDADPVLDVDERGGVHVVWSRLGQDAFGEYRDILYTHAEVPPRRGDLNEDGWVDERDVLPLALGWRQSSGDAGYRAAMDMDASGEVDEHDLLSLIELLSQR